MRSQQRQLRGLSLVELLTVVAVSAIVLTIAIPGFGSIADRNRLRNASEQLRSDLNVARTESLKRNARVSVNFKRNDDGSWCYGLSLNDSCDCAAPADGETACFLDDDDGKPILRVVSSAQYAGITMTEPPSFGNSLTFSPARPILQFGSVSLSARTGQSVRLVTSLLGRIRLCSPDGDGIRYYPAC